MSRELHRLLAREALLTEMVEAETDNETRADLFKQLASIDVRRGQIFDQCADLEDKRLRNTISAIVAGGKVNYPMEDLKKLIAAGKSE